MGWVKPIEIRIRLAVVGLPLSRRIIVLADVILLTRYPLATALQAYVFRLLLEEVKAIDYHSSCGEIHAAYEEYEPLCFAKSTYDLQEFVI